MKSLKIAKMNAEGIMKAAIIYYFIFICVIIGLIAVSDGRSTLSGIEVSTVIFIFVCGLNSFKSNFYFAKSNGISRKTFIKGLLISSVPIALVMSIIDIIINRINNIFIKNPTFYDMAYGNSVGYISKIYDGSWVQSNSLNTIFNTILFQFSLCLLAYVIGIVINMIYYRANKYVKVLVSAIPVALIILKGNLSMRNPSLTLRINEFTDYIFGFNPSNVFACITTFLVFTVVLSAIAFLLIRKATIKER
ncbi:MAG: ABC-2 family transporter protein [uncultured Clostridium sp.]